MLSRSYNIITNVLPKIFHRLIQMSPNSNDRESRSTSCSARCLDKRHKSCNYSKANALRSRTKGRPCLRSLVGLILYLNEYVSMFMIIAML